MVVPAGSGFLFTAVWQPDRKNLVEQTAQMASCSTTRRPTRSGRTPTRPAASQLTRRLRAETACRASYSTVRPTGRPALRELIGGSDPATVNAIRVRSATHARGAVADWPGDPTR
jgi:hypothetical protein